MFCMLGLGGLNVPNTGEGFQNDENRVWGRFQNTWKNIHPCFKVKFLVTIWLTTVSAWKSQNFLKRGT